MVGGASKMAAVRKLVTNLFGVDPRRTVDPMQAQCGHRTPCNQPTQYATGSWLDAALEGMDEGQGGAASSGSWLDEALEELDEGPTGGSTPYTRPHAVLLYS